MPNEAATPAALPPTVDLRPPREGQRESQPGRPGDAGTTDAGSRITHGLRERIGGHRYAMWFDRDRARLSVEGRLLRVDAISTYVADWITRHFAGELATVAKEAIGADATVSVRVVAAPERPGSGEALRRHGRGEGESADGSIAAPPDRRPGSPRFPAAGDHPRGEWLPAPEPDAGERSGRGPIAPPPGERGAQRSGPAYRRLADFVAGPSNQLALDAGQRLAAGEESAPHVLFVHGDCGVGKTHLLQGICERRRALLPRHRIRYTTAEQFTNEYINALRENALEAFRKSLRRLDLLAIDDIHFLANKTATQAEFLHTMDAIDLSGARIVLASDEHPRQIRKFSRSLVSRFLSGMVVRIDRPDRTTRVHLVRRLAAERSLPLQPAVEEFVADRCVGSVREIEGALTRVAAFAALEGRSGPDERSIGLAVAERALAEEGGRPSGPVRIAEVIDRVCARTGVEREELFGSQRHRRIVVARGLAAFLARELTNHSFPEIGRALGRDNHSTVHGAVRRIEQMLDARERIECADDAIAGEDGKAPLSEIVAQLRHDILHRSNGR